MKKFIRKRISSLKRTPQRIPLVILVVCCIIYTFNLTAHSNASIYVNSDIVALYVFIITLASILAIFSYINAYASGKKRFGTLQSADKVPKRHSKGAKRRIPLGAQENPKHLSLILRFSACILNGIRRFFVTLWSLKTLIVAVILVLIQIVLDVLYLDIMFYEIMYRENPVPLTRDIAISMNMTMVHIGSLIAALAAILLKPVYHKAFLKIDTSALDAEDSDISDTTSIDEEFPDEDELDL